METQVVVTNDSFLSEIDVAQRLGLTVKAFQGWRARRVGPAFLKLGAGPRARVRYRLTDLLDWEARQGRAGACVMIGAELRAEPVEICCAFMLHSEPGAISGSPGSLSWTQEAPLHE